MLIGQYIDKKVNHLSLYLMAQKMNWKSSLYSLLFVSFSLVAIFWLSVFIYTTFYFTYLPQESISWPLHFKFRSCMERPGLCSNPNSIVYPGEDVRGSPFARGQIYEIYVDLEMPESPVNRGLGMFSVSLQLNSEYNLEIREVSRSTMIKYKSTLLQTLSTFVFSPFMLFGVQEEKQVISVKMLSDFMEDPKYIIETMKVEVNSMFIEIYSGELRVMAKFSGLRYFMHTYPYITAAFGMFVSMVFFFSIMLFSWYQFAPNLKEDQLDETIFPGKVLHRAANDDPFVEDILKSTDYLEADVEELQSLIAKHGKEAMIHGSLKEAELLFQREPQRVPRKTYYSVTKQMAKLLPDEMILDNEPSRDSDSEMDDAESIEVCDIKDLDQESNGNGAKKEFEFTLKS